MTFTQAVRSCLGQYVGFTGRASRSEFWWFMLFNVLVGGATALVDHVNDIGFFNAAAGLVLYLPNLAVMIRRLHDTNRSGWWVLIALVPVVGVIVLLVWFCSAHFGLNQYGPDPVVEPRPTVGSRT